MNDLGRNAQRPGSGTSATIGTDSVPGSEPEVPGREPPVAHAHAWSDMRFELVNDRPMVRETCATCGLGRMYRAWERYWSPDEGEVRR